MKNSSVAAHLKTVSQLKSLAGDNRFSIVAYERAAQTIIDFEYVNVDIANAIKSPIAGIGPSIKETIQQFLSTGSSLVYDALSKAFPPEMLTMTVIPGVGPKKAYALYQEGFKNFDALVAAKDGKLPARLVEGINTVLKSSGRLPYATIFPIAQNLRDEMLSVDGVIQCEIAGSIRRKSETSKDMDLIVNLLDENKRKNVFDVFCKLGKVINVGAAKSSIIVEKDGTTIQADLWVGLRNHFGALLLYATGSKNHNIKLRSTAKEKGLTLNEYGLFDGDKFLVGQYESDIFKALNVPYVEPEHRL